MAQEKRKGNGAGEKNGGEKAREKEKNRQGHERAFEASGVFREGKAKKRFKKRVNAVSSGFARDKLMSLIGSKHRTKRRGIEIEEFKEMKEDG